MKNDEQAQKAEAPAGLVEEVKAYAHKQYEAKNGMWCPKLEQDLFDMASRYEAAPVKDDAVNDMALPKGRTCRSCEYIRHCKSLFN